MLLTSVAKGDNLYTGLLTFALKTYEYYSQVRKTPSTRIKYIQKCLPEILATNFELAMINVAKQTFPNIDIKCCMFHLLRLSGTVNILKPVKRQQIQKPLAFSFLAVNDAVSIFDAF